MKAKYLVLVPLLSMSNLFAEEVAPLPSQEKSLNLIMGIDLVNQYIWRGQDMANFSLQPTLGVEWKGLSFSTWGSVGFDKDDTKELDFTLAYTLKGFNVGVTDYWFSQGNYFQYKAHKTTHIWEANIGYDFGFLSAQWFTNFAGDDGINDGKRAYSSYFELSAPFSLLTLDWKATFGAVPYATTFYNANGFSVTNLSLRATKDFLIKQKYHLPVFVGVTANPRNEKVYLLCGVSFHL
ncbi:MAG: hypothetical protein IKW91_10950 [Bacteroidaceae bacterium]|nr:hypothetical protein [Bacteroidaceae bacterium]